MFQTPGHRYFIRCPQTRKLNFALRAQNSLEIKANYVSGELLCNFCGQRHKWELTDLIEERTHGDFDRAPEGYG